MSRSKEGRLDRDNVAGTADAGTPTTQPATTNINERLGAKGQTDYTPGRESSREFPRRSTSLRERIASYVSDEPRGRSYDRSYDRDYEGRSGGGYATGRTRETGYRQGASYGSRTDLYSSRGATSRHGSYDRGSSSYDRGFGSERDPYRRHEGRYRSRQENWRDEDIGRYGSGSHGHTLGLQGAGYNRGRGSARDYDRDYGRDYDRDFGSRDFAGRESRSYDREPYDDPYNRESYSGQFGNYETEFDPTRASYGDYDRYGADYGYEGRRDYGYGRNYLRCSEIMTKDVTTCSPQSSLREVADRMEDDNVGSIPVVENGRLLGIVTDRDIVCRVIAEGRDARNAIAADAMSQDLITCTPDDPVIEAIRKMGEHQVRRIPVCDMNGRLRGMISMADIALEAERDRELAHALEQISQPTPDRARR